MKTTIQIVAAFLSVAALADSQGASGQKAPVYRSSFDGSWRFQKVESASSKGAASEKFDDSRWRSVDIPHDWSIENLPDQKPDETVGPFSRHKSAGGPATGNTVGGTAWYRKRFFLANDPRTPLSSLEFDGVYMTADVYVNGSLAASHKYGYTPFSVDMTPYARPGETNTVAVLVQNEGANSRWYAGSGIYRHVTIVRQAPTHLKYNSAFVSTSHLSDGTAVLRLEAEIESALPGVKAGLKWTIYDPKNKAVKVVKTQIGAMKAANEKIVKSATLEDVSPWSPKSPALYTAKCEVVDSEGKTLDQRVFRFGIRTIEARPGKGLYLNGESIKLFGGCMHHDNGFLGAKAIDRAEERRVELMKKFGFNAIRCSHNPPSTAFLDACDRLGVMVVDETFDMWERAKNDRDYHLYFAACGKDDTAAMVRRDRNHPSVIMWSIGNEINERAEALGYRIGRELADVVREHDPSRPVTHALCHMADHPGQDWDTTAPACEFLDVAGYNYMWGTYASDHAKYPMRLMMGTESTPDQAFDTWRMTENNDYVVGDFVWTAMDHLGESGIGCSRFKDSENKWFCQLWPWFNNNSGDIDLCGDEKPQYALRKILWRKSRIEMNVHRAIPEGKEEDLSYWGWPDEWACWNWPKEGEEHEVRVYSDYPKVRLYLNGRLVGEEECGEAKKLKALFKVKYEPGVLKAVGMQDGEEKESTELVTTGTGVNVQLDVDRKAIRASRNDLAFVSITLLDDKGRVCPNDDVPLRLSVTGPGEIAGSGNACPTDMASFNSPICKTFRGRAMAVVRPKIGAKEGIVKLKVEPDGLEAKEISITVK